MCLSAALLPCAALLGVFAMVAVDHDTFDIAFIWRLLCVMSQAGGWRTSVLGRPTTFPKVDRAFSCIGDAVECMFYV